MEEQAIVDGKGKGRTGKMRWPAQDGIGVRGLLQAMEQRTTRTVTTFDSGRLDERRESR